MSRKIEFKIPEPCHVDWHEMTPVEQGRFCNACSKTVVDFREMTDSEVMQHFALSRGSTCGRFMAGQLNRSVTVPGDERRKFSWRYVWKMLLALALNSSTSNAQQRALQGKVVASEQQATRLANLQGDDLTLLHIGKIKFTVVDLEGNQPVPYASLRIPQNKTTMVADSLGNFEISTSLLNRDCAMEISSIGYETVIITPNSLSRGNSQNVVALQRYSVSCAPVVVLAESLTGRVGGAFLVHRYTGFDLIKDTVSSFFADRTVNIFPNPVASGSLMQIRMNLKGPGKYEMIITNSAGQLLSSETFDFVVKNQVRPFLVSQKFPRGLYFLRIQGRDHKESYTKKFFVG